MRCWIDSSLIMYKHDYAISIFSVFSNAYIVHIFCSISLQYKRALCVRLVILYNTNWIKAQYIAYFLFVKPKCKNLNAYSSQGCSSVITSFFYLICIYFVISFIGFLLFHQKNFWILNLCVRIVAHIWYVSVFVMIVPIGWMFVCPIYFANY